MASIIKTVEVDVPVRVAYDQWTQFETFPEFMEGVDEVRQIDDTHLHWVADVAGSPRSGTRRSPSRSRTCVSRGPARPARRTRAS